MKNEKPKLGWDEKVQMGVRLGGKWYEVSVKQIDCGDDSWKTGGEVRVFKSNPAGHFALLSEGKAYAWFKLKQVRKK